jgi:ABC-type multidrug transport system ATPase subunit
MIISSHNLDELDRICDRLTVLKNGRIVFDGPLSRFKKESLVVTIEFQKVDDRVKETIKKCKDFMDIKIEKNIVTIKTKQDLIKINEYLSKHKLGPISIKRGDISELLG